MPAISVSRCWIAVSLLTVLLGGGAIRVVPPAPIVEQAISVDEPEKSIFIPVVRQGRYTLVELEPTAAQRDLLLQVVDVALPPSVQATVGDRLRHVLKRTGWRLCEEAAVVELDTLPLPAAHLHLGPITVHDALLTLVGSAWELRGDERARRMCFVARGDTPDDDDDADTVQIFSLAGAQP